MSDSERPKPPRPSAPTLRTMPAARPPSDPSMRAAGMMRPQAKSDPSLANEKLREYEEQRRREMVVRHDEELRELRDTTKAFMEHAAKMERAVGLLPNEPEPDGNSDPPPAATSTRDRRKGRTKVDTIELDSLKAKYGIYVLFGCWVAEKVLTYFHLMPGAK